MCQLPFAFLTPVVRRLREERDPRQFLRAFARDYAAMSERVRPTSEVLRTAKAVDPEMAVVRNELEGYRFQFMRTVVEWLAEITTLRTSVERATHMVWTLASPGVGRMLCDVQGWTSDEYAAWLEETLAETLVAKP